jgi:hypothetical protein
MADRILARAFGGWLDESLATGRAPESSALLAARARIITALPYRMATAGNWEHLLRVARDRAVRPRSRSAAYRSAACDPAVLVCADQIVAASLAIRELMNVLAAPLPVPARGVAMASVLLTDAAGPVYSGHSRVSLTDALSAAVAQLDPALPLMRCR